MQGCPKIPTLEEKADNEREAESAGRLIAKVLEKVSKRLGFERQLSGGLSQYALL